MKGATAEELAEMIRPRAEDVAKAKALYEKMKPARMLLPDGTIMEQMDYWAAMAALKRTIDNG